MCSTDARSELFGGCQREAYASDASSPRQPEALRFLQQRASDPDLFCIAWPTLIGYVRISTHPRIFAHPLAPAEALRNSSGCPACGFFPNAKAFSRCTVR